MTRERVVPCCRKDGSTLMSTEVAVCMMYVFSHLGGLPHTSHTRRGAPCVAGRGGWSRGTPGGTAPAARTPQPRSPSRSATRASRHRASRGRARALKTRGDSALS